MMRAYAPMQLFGLVQDEGVTTRATHRSQTTSAGAVYHARFKKDFIMETRDSRYKAGGRAWKRLPKPQVLQPLEPKIEGFARDTVREELFTMLRTIHTAAKDQNWLSFLGGDHIIG
jgi:hypothetical protein